MNGSKAHTEGSLDEGTTKMISVYYRSKTTHYPAQRNFGTWRVALAWAQRNQEKHSELCLPNECHSCCDPMNESCGQHAPPCDACQLEMAVYDEADAQLERLWVKRPLELSKR